MMHGTNFKGDKSDEKNVGYFVASGFEYVGETRRL
jgi:hypothetical protein